MDFHPPFGSRGTVSFVLRSDLLLSLRLFSPTLSELTSALEFSSSLRASFFDVFGSRSKAFKAISGATWPILGHCEAGEAQRSLQLPLRDRKGDLGPYSKSSKE